MQEIRITQETYRLAELIDEIDDSQLAEEIREGVIRMLQATVEGETQVH